MALVATKRMFLPIIDESYEEHFDNNALDSSGTIIGPMAPLTYHNPWRSPQDQVDSGYPIFIQPSNPTAQFVYTHDLGATITDGALVTVVAPIIQTVATVDMACTISLSPDDITYTAYADVFSVFANTFRYVRITLDFEADDNHELAIVGPIRLRLTLKKKRDAGSGTSSAVAPVAVTFNQTFLDIRSIVVTAAYNASYPVTAVYDFLDVPSPTGFDVYCYRTDTGAQVANAFSWSVEGV